MGRSGTGSFERRTVLLDLTEPVPDLSIATVRRGTVHRQRRQGWVVKADVSAPRETGCRQSRVAPCRSRIAIDERLPAEEIPAGYRPGGQLELKTPYVRSSDPDHST